MKVIFLDFDGVLNSAASFRMETRRRKKYPFIKVSVSDTLCTVCCSNLQVILDECPDARIVVSSSWRGKFPLRKNKLIMAYYGIDASRVIGETPDVSGIRGNEIGQWLKDHPKVKEYVILDDSKDMGKHIDQLVRTKWDIGLTLPHVRKALKMLGVKENV
jgi:hypothetical protein